MRQRQGIKKVQNKHVSDEGRVCGTVPFGESPDQKKMSRNFKFYFHPIILFSTTKIGLFDLEFLKIQFDLEF